MYMHKYYKTLVRTGSKDCQYELKNMGSYDALF